MLLRKRISVALTLLITLAMLSACAMGRPMANPEKIIPPQPIIGNSGQLMCPYTQDGVVAPWVDKAVNASAGAAVGKAAGALVGAKLMEKVPFVGGFLGSKIGEAAGRTIAIESAGGMEYIRETSDLSFNSLEDMCVWLYATKSTNEHYNDVFKATSGIYPDLKNVYYSAIQNAAR